VRRVVQVLMVVGLAVAGIASAAFASSRGAASPSVAVATPTKITVTMTDFKFKLSKKTVPMGTVVFTVINKGQSAHDFKINGKKTPKLAPGKSAKLRVAGSSPVVRSSKSRLVERDFVLFGAGLDGPETTSRGL
jgi:uncharacterized cupredoxin-like copper-binding protein